MKLLTRAKAIKKFCHTCSGYQDGGVILCPAKECPLYQFRFGFNPGSGRYKRKIALGWKKWPDEAKQLGLE